MARQPQRLHPHLLVPGPAASNPYTNPAGGGGKFSTRPRDRAQHAARIKRQLEEAAREAEARAEAQRSEGVEEGVGITLSFEGEPGFDLKFDSLDLSPSRIELLSVKILATGAELATVFIPDGKLKLFLDKVTAYETENRTKKDGTPGKPKNADLVNSISEIRVAALQELWTDTHIALPDLETPQTWEVWLRNTGSLDHLARLRQRSADDGLRISDEAIEFIDRIVVLVHGTGQALIRSNDLLGAIAEVRLAKTPAGLFAEMAAIEQQEWVDDLAGRLAPPGDDAPHVCLLDSGVNHAHPLLAPVLADDDLHTYKPDWGRADQANHGTRMAGLATYGDLANVFAQGGPVPLSHRLESVKIIHAADPHDPNLYGYVTIESANRVEVTAQRSRVFCMAVTALDGRDRGRPSSWSAAIDDLTSGRTDDVKRLMIVSAGNTDPNHRGDYPNSNMTDAVHDPAQSWNALTVGGFTEKAVVDQTQYPGWQPLAQAGDLAPASCTSLNWADEKQRWPIKPDIVLEAGNLASNPEFDQPDAIDPSLSLLTTDRNFQLGRPLTTFADTSAATALAARMAAMVWAKYPDLTPEAVRGLLIHHAHWTPAMTRRFTSTDNELDIEGLLRCFGHGVPNLTRLLSSLDNSLTLIAQDEITPFHKINGTIKSNEFKLHDLPWPTETLLELQDTQVEMRVTLSYFVEPNPGARGWGTKFGYQSHGLRFWLRRPGESLPGFAARISEHEGVRPTTHDTRNHPNDTGSWLFNRDSRVQALGSIRTNTWTGTAADLASRGAIAVTPTHGWWSRRDKLGAFNRTSRYALIVTITTPETDIYTPIATAIGVPVEIET